MKSPQGSWLALDVGGANLKAAHSSGQAGEVSFELWKRPDELPRALVNLGSSFPPFDRVALTMTGELCDCYATKAIGVRSILNATLAAFPGRLTIVWAIDGRFHSPEEIRERPALAAAANWLALATLAAREVGPDRGLLIDIGSTTTDLIPLVDGRPAVQGRTDTERLQTGELVYAGVRRTPVCSIATEMMFRGVSTGLAAELFATTLDVYLTLGEIVSDPRDHSTADGRPATIDAARDRLARMVGADRDGFSIDDALGFARAIDEVLLSRLESAVSRTGSRPDQVIVAGSGEFLARRLARKVVRPGGIVISLSESWGPVASVAACSQALVVLAREWKSC